MLSEKNSEYRNGFVDGFLSFYEKKAMGIMQRHAQESNTTELESDEKMN